MHFDSFAEFLDMGGYAFYVWLSFGVTFGCLLAIYLEQTWRINKLKAQVVIEHERAQRIKKARQAKATERTENSEPA